METTYPAVEAVDVTHHYGARPVLTSVSLAVAPGELVALVGPNGMGKTTLLGAMAGVLAPAFGHVRIDGMRRRESEEVELDIRRRVVYLPAEPWLPAGRTGREWVLAVGRAWGVADERLFDHSDRLLALFELAEQADQPMSRYSTGQRKKIALCATLATDASILLLDEPFSGGLDPSGILALKRVLQRRNESRVGEDSARKPVTVVMSTPVPELVEELADRVAIINGGRLVAVETVASLRAFTGIAGPFDEVYERLLNPLKQSRIDQYFDAERA
jgi:ABC-type multidrug transport system ATPase subunit